MATARGSRGASRTPCTTPRADRAMGGPIQRPQRPWPCPCRGRPSRTRPRGTYGRGREGP
eukprot:6849442-Alexandrium_andersonii.AAC.1